jgi:hypothetical protein
MSTIFNFAERVNKEFPQISVDALVALYLEVLEAEESETEKVETEKVEPEKVENAPDKPTCKHVYLKGKNAKKQCTTKVKGGGEFCGKHKNTS